MSRAGALGKARAHQWARVPSFSKERSPSFIWCFRRIRRRLSFGENVLLLESSTASVPVPVRFQLKQQWVRCAEGLYYYRHHLSRHTKLGQFSGVMGHSR